jgi:hypothetical protein
MLIAPTCQGGPLPIENVIGAGTVRMRPASIPDLQTVLRRVGRHHDHSSRRHRVLVATKSVDLRKGSDGLVARVRRSARIRYRGRFSSFGRSGPTNDIQHTVFVLRRSPMLASIVRTDVASFAVSPRLGTDMHVHELAA